MRLGRNLLAGLANSAWSALIALAVVPLYLKYLGIEAYGLIGFFATTQVLCQLLDMGLAPTVTREIARCSVSGDLHEARKLLRTLTVVYWGVALAILMLISLLAPLISQYWLQSKQISPETIHHAVILMGFVVATRWPIGLYQGALMGAQRVVVSSSINIALGTIGSLGAVAVLAYISATIEAFFIWQAAVGLAYAEVMRRAAWWAVGREKSLPFDWRSLQRVWRFSAGMSVVALSGIIFAQLDKVILSKLLGLEEFGQYMLATVVVSALYAFSAPFFNVVYPRFAALVAGGSTSQLADLYRLCSRVMATVLFPVAMFLALFGKELVTVWTGDAAIATTAAPVIALLALGSALHGVMYMPYALQLAYGNTRLPIVITFILMAFLAPLIVFLTLAHGAQGAAMAWLTLHVVYLTLGTWLTHRHFLKGLAAEWILLEVGIPFALTGLVGLLGSRIIQFGDFSVYEKLLFGAVMALTAVILSVVTSPPLRIIVLTRLGQMRAAIAG
jgi:O-antigen/teichoic acid export membrane protein